LSRDGLKQGDEITCKACKKTILVAARDIPYGAELKSEYLKWADGTPVAHHAECVCPKCWIKFATISTERAETILTFDIDSFPTSHD
jgi:hypothetical protein